MARPTKGKKGKRSKHSTTRPKRSVKVKPDRKVQTAAESRSEEEPCTCCPDCVGKPSGTLGQCEDEGCVDILPAPYFAVLVRDPAGHGGLWYPERPANFPAAELADLAAAIVANMPAAVLQALALALAPYLNSRVP